MRVLISLQVLSERFLILKRNEPAMIKMAIGRRVKNPLLWLYLYRARSKITQLLTPTRAQLQRNRLKFIKKPFKNSYMFRSTTIFRELQYPR